MELSVDTSWPWPMKWDEDGCPRCRVVPSDHLDALFDDMASVIGQHMAMDDGSDEKADWITDLMSELTPLVLREIAAVRSEMESR